MDSMFSVAGNPGIKVVDVGVMLGVHRTTLEKNGIRLVKLDQTAKIEEYWTQYEDRRKKKPKTRKLKHAGDAQWGALMYSARVPSHDLG
eukprot:COSAG01_NODE_7161_length_3323_cov_23.332403_2_plen_89_part_00